MRPFPRPCSTGLTAVLLGLAAVTGWAQESPAPGPAEPDDPPRFHASAEVVASRLADDPQAAGRREVVLGRDEIAALPVATVQDALAAIPGLGLLRRGARGVQGDLNLRGSTFEQVVVMVNGLRVNNPQTGHHHLDLFLPLAAIERIEVVAGPGSAVHGPDAFGGVVNIVTGRPAPSAFVRAGEHGLAGGGVAGSVGRGIWAAAEREVHTGFQANTEADRNLAAAGWSFAGEKLAVDLTAAAGERSFGAAAFYSAAYPDQRERTSGGLLTMAARSKVGEVAVDLALRLNRHLDDYVLDRHRPDWYHNAHRTDGILWRAAARGKRGHLDWGAGLEGSRDAIESSNLGNYRRQRGAVFAELGRFGGRTSFGLQLRADHQSPWGTEASAGAGGAVVLGRGLRLRGHAGRSVRAPSFTELYYQSPATAGNPDLGPEIGWGAELGLDLGAWSATVFARRTEDLIDYILGGDGVWRAGNAGRLETVGLELGWSLPAAGRLQWQRVGIVVVESDLAVDPGRSRYALAHPRLEAAFSGAASLGPGCTAGWNARVRDPSAGGSWAVLDLRLERRILAGMSMGIEASNLFDRELSELPGVRLPGRWIAVTMTFRGEAR